MTTGLYYDDHFLDHDTGPHHPERPDRLRAVTDALKRDELWDRLTHPRFKAADPSVIGTVHDSGHAERVRKAVERERPYLDSPDTPISADSYAAAMLAVGAGQAAVDAVMSDKVDRAFCAVRPPGHHAERDKCMGFCLFNNIALAAQRLIDEHDLQRVAIVDFDVHHGNGTQHLFERRADVLFISMHEHPDYQYPGTGYAHETGQGDGTGYTLNVPLHPGAGHEEAVAGFKQKILPRLDEYRPEFLLISAGFDADADDPLGHLEFTADTYRWMTHQLMQVADRHCKGRLVSLLEGGYDLDALGRDVSVHVATLINK